MNTIEKSAMRIGTAAIAMVLGLPATGLVTARAAARVTPPDAAPLLARISFTEALANVDGDDDEKAAREDELYEDGTDAIDEGHWQEALDKFDQVIKLHGKRTDAALYWKAWSQNKLGQRPAALATLAELKRTAPASRWTNDAKALEIEIRQDAKQPVPVDDESNCELKLLAINGLQQMDPEKAVPMLEKMLHGPTCPKLRGQALFVLAQSSSPQAREIIARAARNNDDPDLQRKAIRDLGLFSGEWGRQQLSDLYSSVKDTDTRKRILQAFMVAGDKDHLLAAAKGEKEPELRAEAIQQLGVMGARDSIWQLYQTETAPEVKKRMLQAMFIAGDLDHLTQLAKMEKDHDLRLSAIRDLGLMGERSGDTLVAMYSADKDPEVRHAVIQSLFISNNAHALVALARKETDPEMKKSIVRQLSLMHSKEATDYLMEILNK
ncbi:MAG TPA: tetratricopeptide repeat protein [Candidatus Acidoferrales bacterium]|nr:tetratricopeptide repeat protein [Candidatus Acidoferrales bacterium]